VSFLHYDYVSPDFSPPLALVLWRDRKGFFNYTEASRTFQKGYVRSLFGNLFVTNYRNSAGILQEGGYSTQFVLNDRYDKSIQLSYGRTKYSGTLDDQYSVNLEFGSNNRFNSMGIGYSNGIQSDVRSRTWGIDLNRRIGAGLDVSLRHIEVIRGGANRQDIGTISWQKSPSEVFSGRVLIRDGKSNASFSYRKSGFAGNDFYFIYGDPNALTSKNRLAMKLVRAF
jgi:hypothetical protein